MNPWRLEHLAGRITELKGNAASASLSMAMGLVLEAQKAGQPSAWIDTGHGSFFPPDAQALGIDLAALPVLRVGGARAAARVADKLLRSGAFGLLVTDMGANAAIEMPLQSRLLGLAREHGSALLFLTETSSLGPLVSTRLLATRGPRTGPGFECRLETLKDKATGPGWSYLEIHRGPPGLR